MRQLTLPEAATLAGLIQIPSYRNPVRWPERAKARRNVVLKAMLENNYITQYQYLDAVRAPLVLSRQGPESADAPYFVDLGERAFGGPFQDRDFLASGIADLHHARSRPPARRVGGGRRRHARGE